MKASRRRLWLFLSIGGLLLLERAITGVQVDFGGFRPLAIWQIFSASGRAKRYWRWQAGYAPHCGWVCTSGGGDAHRQVFWGALMTLLPWCLWWLDQWFP
jgi:hypothetical protein